MNIDYRDGLLFTSIEIEYRGKLKVIDSIVIDTGAAESIISPDIVDEIEIYPEEDDEIVTFVGVGGSEHHSFVKKVNTVKVGSFLLKDIELDFGIIDPKGKIKGLLGLDILVKVGAVIDLKGFKIL